LNVGRPTGPPAVLQTTAADASVQNITDPLGGSLINAVINVSCSIYYSPRSDASRRILELAYFRAQFDAVCAFGHNSADSEPIWMKICSTMSTLLGLALADFGVIHAVAPV